MTTLLFADDDPQILSLLSEYLVANDFRVITADNGSTALEKFKEESIDLVLLDVMMPKLDGVETLKSIRTQSNVPIIMLTAKNEDVDRIEGLEFGADDYIAKPFNPREIVARIKAVLRRYTVKAPSTIDGLELNSTLRSANYKAQALQLTTAEFLVLQQLLLKTPHPIDRETLTKAALDREITAFDRAIDVHVSNLRKKLTSISDQLLIKNIRGKGYQLIDLSETC